LGVLNNGFHNRSVKFWLRPFFQIFPSLATPCWNWCKISVIRLSGFLDLPVLVW